MWKEYDENISNLLPESAEKVLNNIEKQALKDKNDVQLLKTVLRRSDILNMKEENPEEEMTETNCGSLLVIENVFHYKQVLPLRMGDNSIGRYMKGSKTTLPIETNDPSVDMLHCVINVSRGKNGQLKYVLRDGPSNTGTFVDNEILGDRERRIIHDGTLFTIGATSIILKTETEES